MTDSNKLPWWASQRTRLAVLLSCLAVLVSYLVVTRAGLFGAGGEVSEALGGLWAPGCPSRAAPSVARAAPGGLLELRSDLRGVARGVVPRRLYRLGTVTSDNAWSDNFPQRVVISHTGPALMPGGYEMRWWATRTDLVDDAWVFDQAGEARRFFDLAASPRCRREGARVPMSSPPGARGLVWRNPDAVVQEDVFFLRGDRVYRVSGVRDQGGRQARREQRIGFAIASGVACALPDAGCRDAGLRRRLAFAALAGQ